jgi:hypothetical protein
MFENLSDRIAGGLLVGLDVAVEFATLGEVRLVDPELFPAETSTVTTAWAGQAEPRRRLIELADVDHSLLPQPSTALARAAAPAGDLAATRSVVVAAPCERRRRSDSPKPVRRQPTRARGGSVQPAAQLCLLVD